MLKLEEAWWREESLGQSEHMLLDAVCEAHAKSALRASASSVAVANAAAGSGEVGNAIIAGLLTLGGKHAPLEETYKLLSLSYPEERVGPIIKAGLKVPGWGGTFQGEQADPIWIGVYELLNKYWPRLAQKIDGVTTELHKYGKLIQPNPSAFTAAAAIALKLPAKLAVYLFISARLGAWAHITLSHIEEET